jgi:hypothetical protein
MWLILAAGIATLASAISFAWKPGEHKLARIRPLSLATVFASLSGTLSGVGATVHHIAADSELARTGTIAIPLLAGIGESLAPAILGFAILTVCWLVIAAGLRRLE